MTRINDKIKAPKIRVVDGETHQQIGVMTPMEALRIAQQRGLDLVEVSPEAKPPVCKIVSYGKWKYQQSKHKKGASKPQGGKVKEIKFRINIDPHDYGIKMAHAEEFLDENNKIRVNLQFRGREVAHPEIGFQLMKRIQADLETMGHADAPPRHAGKNISMMVSPLSQHQRHRKFAKPVAAYVESEVFEDEDESDHGKEEGEADEPHAHTLNLEEILEAMDGDAGRPPPKRKKH
jgi:translation initiation factor IF-3